MLLPKCVVIKYGDPVPAGARHIGTRLTYVGDITRTKLTKSVSVCPGVCVLPIAKEIKWQGRLWKDPEISVADAWRETKRFIARRNCHVLYNVAFVIMDGDRVSLIGVHPAAQGLGLAAKLLQRIDHPSKHFVAGTYADNHAAIKLYRKLGMNCAFGEEVYHL